MTREEAIKILEYQHDNGNMEEAVRQALAKAINALAVFPQYKWERDVALKQLEEYEIGFAEKKRDMVEVGRCKDCKASRVYGKTTQWLACEDVMEGQATDPNGYCYLGERKEESEVEE